jgi:hypothetical protein
MSKGKREREKVRMPFGQLVLKLGSFVQLALSPQQLAISQSGNWVCLGLFLAQPPAAGF